MDLDSSTVDYPLPSSSVRRLERISTDFESACRAGQQPRIEHYLGDTPEPDRSLLLRALLTVEVTQRTWGGACVLETYLSRFPHHAVVIRIVLQEVGELRALADTVVNTHQTAASPPLPAEPIFPGYEIFGELGRGGMAIVYKARQRDPERIVALKAMRRDAGTGPRARARFRAEAEVLSRLRYPNIVRLHGRGEQDGWPYLVLEYVPGGTLAARLAGQPQRPDEAATLIKILARAIHYAHVRGVVHRDLKPANVLLVQGPETPLSECTPKIADFGLFKRMDAAIDPREEGNFESTAHYAAPEQAAGDMRAIGPATDVHALGAILYEMLTGQRPFRGRSLADILDQVQWQPPVPPRRLRRRIPRRLQAICLKCLAKEPNRRYASALELAEDLRRFLREHQQRWPHRLWRFVARWHRGWFTHIS
jgi:serine/threonine protein kinase